MSREFCSAACCVAIWPSLLAHGRAACATATDASGRRPFIRRDRIDLDRGQSGRHRGFGHPACDMDNPALQPCRCRVIHAHELPHRFAVGNDGVRERLITPQGQCAVQVDGVTGMRCPRTRGADAKNESGEKEFSKHSDGVRLHKCRVGNFSLRPACMKKAVPGRGRLRQSTRRDLAAPLRYCTTTDNVTPGGSVTVSW